MFNQFVIYMLKLVATTESQRYIIRKLLDINFKISTIYEQQQHIKVDAKVDDMKNHIQTFSLDDGVKKKNVAMNYMDIFPLEILENLEKLERLLKNNKIDHKTLYI